MLPVDDETVPVAPDLSQPGGDRYRLGVLSGAGMRLVILPREGAVTIGRHVDCAVHLDDPSVSRHHAQLTVGPIVRIDDLGSKSGTWLGEQRLTPGQPAATADGAIIRTGAVSMVLIAPASAATAPVAPATYAARRAAAVAAAPATGDEYVELTIHVESTANLAVANRALAVRFPDIVATTSPSPAELQALCAVASVAEATSQIADLARDLRPMRIGSRFLPDPADPDDDDDAIVIQDDAMRRLHATVAQLAVGSIAILIHGETGTGKESIAAAIHRHSPRAQQRLLRVNCAALSDSLLESELFGHERGAFTGAHSAKAGILEACSGGSLFLDEIGELSLGAQAKLLRCLEEGRVTRVGGTRELPIDVRFIAATNRDLEREVTERRFRHDLYFRIAAATLSVPPLRDRRSEIAPLADRFARRAWRRLGRDGRPTLSPAAIELLERAPWPGNIRELRNVIERAVLLCPDGTIREEHIPGQRLQPMAAPAEASDPPATHDLRERIARALRETGGNQTRAARHLGVSRVTLSRWLDQVGLPRPRKHGD